MGGEPADYVAEIAVILSARHPIETPMAFVVGVKKYEIGFNTEIAQIGDPFFEVLKEFGIESGEIPIARSRSFEWIQQWLICIPIVMLWENAKANFVERGGGECF